MDCRIMCVFPGILLESTFSWIGEVLPECRITPITYLNNHHTGDLVFEDFSSPKSLFQHVKPELVLFKSISSYHEIAINRYAQTHGIPTVLIGHGDQPPQSAEGMININRPEHTGRLERLKMLLSFYLWSAPLSEWQDRLQYISLAKKTGNPYVSAQKTKIPLHRADYALVLNEESAETLRNFYRYNPEQIIVMGDPQAEIIKDIPINRDYVLFVDTDLSALQNTLENVSDPWYEMFSIIFCVLPPEAPIIIRLHPNTPIEKYQFVQNIPGVSISYDKTAVQDLAGAALVCGFRSTLLSLALAMDKPVLLADQWDTYFPAFPAIVEGLYLKTSVIQDKITPAPWPVPSQLDAVRLEKFRTLRGYGLPSRKIAGNLFHKLVSK